MTNGKIIVIEGTDKAGKTTQSKLLYKNLIKSGKHVQLINFPDYGTSLGQEINQFLKGNKIYSNEVKHMLLSANRWEKKEEILNIIRSGTHLILNRYYQSNLVYGFSNGLDSEWLINLDKGLPKEDLVIVIDINPQVSFNRYSNNRDLFERNDLLLEQVRENYHRFAKLYNWTIINGERDVNTISVDIFNLVKQIVK